MTKKKLYGKENPRVLFMLLIAGVMLAFGFAACNKGAGKSNSSLGSSANGGSASNLADSGGGADLAQAVGGGGDELVIADKAAVTKLLSFGGLSESDIRPDGLQFYTDLDEDSFAIYVEKPLGEAGNKAWVKKIFDKIKQVSSDKKVYQGGYDGNEEIADSYEIRDFNDTYDPLIIRWVYHHKGKWVLVSFGHGALVDDDGCHFYIEEN